jgi:hypothetical protein
MATAKQIAANRANARRSTGPRTAAGRAKSSRNSFRHGLSLPLSTDPQMKARIDLLANAIAGEHPSQRRLQAAITVAEAQLDLKRIHDVQIEVGFLRSDRNRDARLAVTAQLMGAESLHEAGVEPAKICGAGA